MVSNRNKKYLLARQNQRVPHYGLRKLSVGVASVLLSITILMWGSASVHADASGESAEGQSTPSTISPDNVADPSQNKVVLQSRNSGSENTTDDVTNTGKVNSDKTASQTADNSQLVTASLATISQSTAPAATHSINDQVGKRITVTDHEVTQTEGKKETGTPGIIKLHLGLQITADEASQIKSGDYIDVKLGLPYGNHQVFSYGSINAGAYYIDDWKV